jgi:ferredoxin-NADP reductase
VDYTAATDAPRRYIDLLHPENKLVKVTDIREENSSTKTFRLTPVDGYLPPFLAGQYVTLFLEINGIRTGRPYSISSSPGQRSYYDITVRRVPDGLVSNHLIDEVSPGREFNISGPGGNFYYNPLFHDKTMVMLAGGSGITPFYSMIQDITEKGLDRIVYLFCGNRTHEDAIFHTELESIAHRFENIHYLPVLESPPEGYTGNCGLITGTLIRETLGDLNDKTFYLCGPQGMYDFCMPDLDQMGIPKKKIRNEVYGVPKDIATDPAWPRDLSPDREFEIEIRGGKRIKAKAGVPILVTLENAEVLVPHLCRSGDCGVCRIKVLSGKVFQPPGVRIRKSDAKYGYIHSCAAYPMEDLEILPGA